MRTLAARILFVAVTLALADGCGSISAVNSDGGGAAGGTGTGGHAGSGGASGSGGTAGSAGVSGSSGKGGASGMGGTSGRNETCDQLQNDYLAAIPAAQSCSVGASGECQVLVSSSLSTCAGCQTYVNDASTLNDIKQRWQDQGCDVSTGLCPAIACLAPSNNTCSAGDGGGACK